MDVIKVKDVTKKFRIYYDRGGTLKEKILFRNRNKYEDRWVLKGINLTIQKGETVGLIGENGSGKSTLLKLLTKIIYPDTGSIEINGKVSSLLELGAGFHPDMTGRENIYMNASIFGLTKEEIDKRIQDIIDFSELEEFIDNPVRTYSSGMYMRLAFSVAINVEAEILLIDEILAVGDVSFQKKCLEKLIELKNIGKTIVFVSHDSLMIQRLCDRAVWIEGGKIREYGNAKEVINYYLDFVSNRENDVNQNKMNIEKFESVIDVESEKSEKNQENVREKNELRWGNKDIEICNVEIRDKHNITRNIFKCGDNIKVLIEYKFNKKVEDVVFGFCISSSDETCCYGTNTYIDEIKINKFNGFIELDIKDVNLMQGKYFIDIAAHDQYGLPYDYIKKVSNFTIETRTNEIGVVKLNHEWKVDNN